MKKLLIVIFVVIILAVGMGINELRHNKPAESPNKTQPAIPVTSTTLHANEIDISEEFPGRTTAFKIAEIRPQVGGIITNRLFIEGSVVKKGDQLYQIDQAPYQASYDSANADLAKAIAVVKSTKAKALRYKELIKIEAISKQDYDDINSSLEQAEADVNVAKAALNVAKINLEYTKVYAPISGRIGKSSVTVGALVSANQTTALASITQLDPIYVDVTQANEDMQRLRDALKDQQKQPVNLFFQNGDKAYAHKGELQFSDVTVDPTTGSVQLRMLFPNPEEELLPGMFVRAKMNVKLGATILVPQQATIRGPDGNLKVWVIGSDNTVKPVSIKAERTVGDAWLVSSGLADGDKIVLEGIQKIFPGALVVPTEMSKTEEK